MKFIIKILIISFLFVNCNDKPNRDNKLTSIIKDYINFISDKNLYVIVEEVQYDNKIVFRINSFSRLYLKHKNPKQIYKSEENTVLFYSTNRRLNLKKQLIDINKEIEKKYDYDLFENNGEWYYVLCAKNNSQFIVIKDNWYYELNEIEEINALKCNGN